MKAPIVAALCVQSDVVVRRQNASLVSLHAARPLLGFFCFSFCLRRAFLFFELVPVPPHVVVVVVFDVVALRRKGSWEFTDKLGESREVFLQEEIMKKKKRSAVLRLLFPFPRLVSFVPVSSLWRVCDGVPVSDPEPPERVEETRLCSLAAGDFSQKSTCAVGRWLR